jgi:hypothetical protein
MVNKLQMLETPIKTANLKFRQLLDSFPAYEITSDSNCTLYDQIHTRLCIVLGHKIEALNITESRNLELKMAAEAM